MRWKIQFFPPLKGGARGILWLFKKPNCYQIFINAFYNFRHSKLDEFAKSHFYPDFVIPAKAGIQLN